MPSSGEAWDFALTIDGTKYLLDLAAQEGVKQWSEGLAPMLSPQVLSTGFGYEHVPPQIEVPLTVEDLTQGAGYSTAVRDHQETAKYSYSRGVNASYGDKWYVSDALQSMQLASGSEISAAPVTFLDSSLGFFAAAGAYIYEWDVGALEWAERDDASGDSVNYTSLVELNGVIYAARGSGADYKYSSDGTSWTAFTDTDNNADYFAVRGNVLWKILSNVVKNTTNGQNSGTSWSGGDTLGHTGETTNGFVEAADQLFALKKEGFYSYTGSTEADIFKSKYLSVSNGKNPYRWEDGNLYVPYGERLLGYNPYGDTLSQFVYPPTGADSLELQGDITAIAGDSRALYLAIKNREGNTYIMRGSPSTAWHSILYLGANDCDALTVAASGSVHASNPALVIGYGTSSKYTVLPRAGLEPGDDPNCVFSTSEGLLYGPYLNFGARTFDKFLNRGGVLVNNGSAGRPVTLKYDLPNSSPVTVVTATDDGLAEADVAAGVEFTDVRFVVSMTTGDENASPVAEGLMLYASLNPRRKRMWTVGVHIGDAHSTGDGVRKSSRPSAGVVRDALFGAVNKALTLTDRDGNTYNVRLLEIQSQGVVNTSTGNVSRDLGVYMLNMVEINSLTTNETQAVYGEHAYNSGAVYA